LCGLTLWKSRVVVQCGFSQGNRFPIAPMIATLAQAHCCTADRIGSEALSSDALMLLFASVDFRKRNQAWPFMDNRFWIIPSSLIRS
jgi:hypothetical protein